MRRILLALLVAAAPLAACSTPGAEPDPGDGTVDGDWRLSWACVDGCGPLPEPALTYVHALTIRDATLTGTDELCSECRATDVGWMAEDCVEIPAQTRGIDQLGGYRACLAADGTLTAAITATRLGTSWPSTWRLTGTRR